MRKWFWGLLWVGAGLCGAAFSPIACITHTCTLVGCSDTEELTFSVSVAQLSDTQVVACRNERCWHGPVAAVDLKTIMKQHRLHLTADDGSNSSVECLIDTPLPAGTARFSFAWDTFSDAPVAVGDVLSATFTDSSDNVVFSAKGTISSFEVWFPNGEDCDKEGCRAGSVEGRAD